METAIEEIASFRVTFDDGKILHILGWIEIHPKLTFKELEMLIFQAIRPALYPNEIINPNQFLIYLTRASTFPDQDERLLITNKVTSEFIIRLKDVSYIHVDIKKPERFFYFASLGYCYNNYYYALNSWACYYQPSPDDYQTYHYPLSSDAPVIMDHGLENTITKMELVATEPIMDDELEDRKTQMELAATEPIMDDELEDRTTQAATEPIIYDGLLDTLMELAATEQVMDDGLQDRIKQMELAVATEPIDIRVSDVPDLGPAFILVNDCNYERQEKTDQKEKAKAFCEECEKDEVGIGSFHCCVNDQVIAGFFKTSAGPIARPPTKASYRTVLLSNS